jgi:hypothetical protein
VRADLNNALAALITNSSGASSPSTTYAYQWWADTTSGQLKLRNSANNAWITIFELDGTMLMEDGTASAPGLAFASDLNTGFFRSAADTLAIATAGTQRFTIDGSGNLDLGANSGSSSGNGLFMQPNGQAFLFTPSAVDALNIYQGATRNVLIKSNGAATFAGGLSVDALAGNSTVCLLKSPTANAYLQLGNSANDQGYLGYQSSDMTFLTAAAERMRLDSSGRLLVGTTTEGHQDADNLTIADSSKAGITIRNTTATGDGAIFFSDGDSGGAGEYAGFIEYGHSGNHLRFATNAAERMRLDSSGRLLVGATSLSDYGIVNAVSNSASAALRAVGQSSMPNGSAAIKVDKHANVNTTGQVFMAFTINVQSTGSGQINANGASQAAFGSFSDRRLKENIVDIPSQLKNICKLRPVEFDYIESEGGGHQISFIAQEIEKVYPDAIGEREDGMKTLTGWGKTEAILVKALQEAIAKIETLETKVAVLEAG